MREARAVATLDHPSIATLYDLDEVDGSLCLAFKYIDGETVARRTAGGPLPLAEAVAIAADVANALAHAHARGVIHRDVSAGNVMVDRDGRGVLVDFGLARIAAQLTLTHTGTVRGTLPYLAPEVVLGKRGDARSDLYALGAVLYRMITGRVPFEGEHSDDVRYQILNRPLAAPSSLRPGLPHEVDDVVLRGLEKDPHDRYHDAEAFAVALRRLQGLPAVQMGTPVAESRVAGWLHGLNRSLRRRSVRATVAVFAVLALTAVSVAVAWRRGWRPPFMTPRIPVVVVLPARNASEDAEETAYLAEGLGEELVSRLQGVEGLRLIPWITSQRFRDPSKPLPAVARETRASALVICSYRSDGDRLRVTASLVDGSGIQRWSQVYEEDVENLFAVQREIVLGVASHFRLNLSAHEREQLSAAPATSAEAYEFFLRGASFFRGEDPQGQAFAQPYFEKALELDPGLEEAWVGLGALYVDRYFLGNAGQAELAKSEQCFRKALAINPTAIAAERGLVSVYYERGQSEQGLRLAASRRHEDEEGMLLRAWSYVLCGLPEKAVPILDGVLERDPANQSAAWYRVVADAWAGETDKTIADCRSYLQVFGEDPEVYSWLGESWQCQGDHARAVAAFDRALELFGDESTSYVVALAAAAYRDAGKPARARQLLDREVDLTRRRLESYPDNQRWRAYLVGLLCGLGRIAEARREIDTFLAVASSTNEPSAGAALLIAALAGVGDHDRAQAVCRLVESRDSLDALQIIHLCFIDSFALNPDWRTQPYLLSLMDSIRKRHDELAARY